MKRGQTVQFWKFTITGPKADVRGTAAVPLISEARLGYWITCCVMGDVNKLTMLSRQPRNTRRLAHHISSQTRLSTDDWRNHTLPLTIPSTSDSQKPYDWLDRIARSLTTSGDFSRTTATQAAPSLPLWAPRDRVWLWT